MDAQKHKFPTLIPGEFIVLSKIMERDAAFIHRLRTSEGAKYLNQPKGYCLESQIKWQESRGTDEVNYIIYDKKEEISVGMVSIYECDWDNGVSNVGRLLLVDKYVHNSSPYGLEALKMTYGYVFKIMGFRKISGIINSKNVKVVSLQKYLGMVEEGYFRGHVLLHGEPQDLNFLSLFKEDFQAYSDKIDLLLNKFRK
jgi:RimJ/RimL family protein N-acetyltransferase